MTVSVSRNFNTLNFTTGNCLNIAEVVNIVIEVASNEEFVRGGGCVGKKR